MAKITVEEYDVDSKKRAYNVERIKMSALSRLQYDAMKASYRNSLASNADGISVADLFELVKTYDKKFQPKPVNPELLNEDGTPKVVYHGTRADFTVFDKNKEARFGRKYGDGFYFTDDYEKAFKFANGLFSNGQDRGGKIMPVYLNIKKPYIITQGNKQAKMPNGDYDGIIDTTTGYYFVYSPEQIKSATDNMGTFDGNDSDILRSKSDDTREDLKKYLDYDTISTRGTKYWTPDISKKQLAVLKDRIATDIETSTKNISDTANWLLTRIDGMSVFAIYSTEHIDDPTILYESKGEKALIERDILLNVMEAYDNEEGIDGKPSAANQIHEGDWLQHGSDIRNNTGQLVRGGSDRNAGILQGQSKRKGSRAFGNVLKNIFEIREDVPGGRGRRNGDLLISESDTLRSKSEEDEGVRYFPPGEAPRRDVKVPSEVDGKKVRRFVRTAAEAPFVSDEVAEKLIIEKTGILISKYLFMLLFCLA